MDQRTDEWFAARLGKVTASRVADVIAKTKSGYSTSRQNYLAELVLERMTGRRQESFTNAAMQRGTEMEPVARAAYEAMSGEIVEEVGLILHPRLQMSGASPDGVINTDGLLEIKVPNSATHMNTLLTGKPDGKYVTQMQWQMSCTGRRWCDFVSYDDRFPAHLQLFVTRIQRDDKLIAELEFEVEQFLIEVDQMVERLSKVAA
jgi:putative phage-type endonuclease